MPKNKSNLNREKGAIYLEDFTEEPVILMAQKQVPIYVSPQGKRAVGQLKKGKKVTVIAVFNNQFFIMKPSMGNRTIKKRTHYFRISKIDATSTQAFFGREFAPTAILECFPFSPIISQTTSDAPLMTRGWSENE